VGQEGDAREGHREDRDHDGEGGPGVLPLGRLEGGTPSEIASTPVRAAQPELKARSTTNSPSAPAPASSSAARGRLLDREPVQRRADEARPDHDEHAHEEEVGRHSEDRAGLPDAAQVQDRDQHHQRHAQPDPVRVQLREGRHDRRHRRRDRDRHRQQVGHQQRRPRDERRAVAQVVLGDDVAAAAGRVGLDRLAVRRPHDHEQDDDRRADRQADVEVGQPARHEQTRRISSVA
jgi:hypothetical protein